MTAPRWGVARPRPSVSARWAMGTGLLGASVLIGGLTNQSRLTRWVLDRPSALPVTGAILVLLAVALGLRRQPHLAAIPAFASGVLVTLAALARLTHRSGPLASWSGGVSVRDHGLPGVPQGSSIVGLLAATVAIGLLLAGATVASQVMVAVPFATGSLALLSLLYGDRVTAVERAPFPGTMTAAPAAVGLILLSVGVLTAEPSVGISGWISADSPGRRAARRLLPVILLVPLGLAGAARWFELDRHVGVARSWALVMSVVTVGMSAVVIAAAGLIDRLAAAARRGEITELRLTSALRLARVADLARGLAGAATIEEVSEVVNTRAAAVLAARAASVGMIDHNAGLLRVHHGPGVSDAIRSRYANPSLDASLAFTDAARTGEPILIGDYDEYRDRYPASDPSNSQLGPGARASLPLVDRSGTTFGSLALSWDHPLEFDDGVTATLSTISDLVAQSLERARLTDALARQARRNAELARLAEALAAAATTADVLAFLAEHVTGPLDAATAVVGLIGREEGVLYRHFSSGTAEALARHMATEPLSSEVPLVDSARDGRTVVLRSRGEVEARYPDTLAVFDAAGFTATAHVPLRDRTGASFGALGLGWHDPVEFDDGLLTMLSTVGDLAAQTLERAWLGDARTRDGDRARDLASLAEALAVAKTSHEVAMVVVRDLGVVLRGASADIALVVEGTDELELHGGPANAPTADDLDVRPRIELTEQRPHPDAIRIGTTIFLANRRAYLDRYPHLADDVAASGVEAVVVVPVMTGDDRPLAAIGISWMHAINVDDSFRSTVSTIGELVGQTLERVELAEAEHHLVVGLQRQIVGPIPSIDGLEISALYEPAALRLGMGGDWYEGVVLGGGSQLGLVVGDVTGHGTDAAVEMLQLSRVLSTLLHVGVTLDDFFELVGRSVSPTSIYATALVCHIDPAAQTLSYVAAGHLPPVLIPASSPARLLASGRHPMIGMPAFVVPASAAQFGPGATLVAYTDGLIERRDEGIDDGLERLRQACEDGRHLDPDALIEHLVTICTEGHLVEDDLAVVVVRATG